jgi:hypothetical protein
VSRLVQYFPNADLRSGYDGLYKVAKRGGLDLKTIKNGEFCAFVNRKKDKLKLATHSDFVAYLRLPRGQQIDPRVIQVLPEFFNGTKIEYSRALENVLKKQFPRWFEKTEV